MRDRREWECGCGRNELGARGEASGDALEYLTEGFSPWTLLRPKGRVVIRSYFGFEFFLWAGAGATSKLAFNLGSRLELSISDPSRRLNSDHQEPEWLRAFEAPRMAKCRKIVI
ncbi:hypothetical protein GYMLUDRAFT_821430 [Collybiopsis luxurians FD-317 M1]|uniref:Uncharacterized protein n=1 Tax=Collybiopsis luxurians FD-317 M1 TaxID=944289 RepID=A0A0D0CM02_9AGAR|nr:hypothetical protein GYMLUDRAFT_821430 [Collybiopsis luxurians FD-317 M1]